MITFNAVDTPLPPLDQARVARWVERVAEGLGKRAGDINFIFASDREMLRLNRQFLGHDYYTDHIGFDYTRGRVLRGDVYIGAETVRSNALEYGDTFGRELLRVVIHGALHLAGLRDATPQERRRMTQEEDKALDTTWKTLT